MGACHGRRNECLSQRELFNSLGILEGSSKSSGTLAGGLLIAKAIGSTALQTWYATTVAWISCQAWAPASAMWFRSRAKYCSAAFFSSAAASALHKKPHSRTAWKMHG